jgi:hypothetical protein
MNKKILNVFGNVVVPILPLIILVSLLAVFFFITNKLDIQSTNGLIFCDKESALEYFWRMIWASLFVIIVFLSIINSLHAIKIIKQHASDMPGNIQIHVLVLTGMIVYVLYFLLRNGGYFGAVKYFLDDASRVYAEIPMQEMVDIQFLITTITAFLITLSSGALMFHKGAVKVNIIQRKNSDFKRSFYLTAIYLGIAIIQFFSLATWASHASGVSESHKTIVHAITISSSVLYTLIFVVMFAPVSFRVRALTETLVGKTADLDTPKKIMDWKIDNGLYDSPANNFKQLLVLFSPVLIGMLSSFIGKQ